MKILVISTNGLISDGITAWITQIFCHMEKTDFQVWTVAWEGSDRSVCDSVEQAGVSIEILPSRQARPLRYFFHLERFIKQSQFDIVHVCGNSSLLVLELLAAFIGYRKAIRIVHSRNTTCNHRVMHLLLRPIMLRLSDVRLACGEDAGKWLFALRPYTVLPNGKNPSHYKFDLARRNMMRKELRLQSYDIAIGHVGMFNRQKNHKFVIDIFKQCYRMHSNARLFLIGEGALFDEVADYAALCGISDRVRFLGRRDDVPDLLNAMDCMLLPSLFEGLPNVVIEWQYSGLPCVLSDSITRECAITDLISYLSLDDSVEEWANAIDVSVRESTRADDSEKATKALVAAGYDIKESAMLLRRIYLGAMKSDERRC